MSATACRVVNEPRSRRLTRGVFIACGALLVSLGGCIDQKGAQQAIDAILPGGARPDVMPRLLNRASPFVYPRAQYDAGVPGDVLLRLWIDTSGTPVRDSTIVQEHARHAAFDSATLAGAPRLRFSPAMMNGQPVAVAVLLPVKYRKTDTGTKQR